jgi:hypothetical protein
MRTSVVVLLLTAGLAPTAALAQVPRDTSSSMMTVTVNFTLQTAGHQARETPAMNSAT